MPQNRKNILCLIESLNSGGAERQLTYLAMLLKEKGYNVSVGVFMKSDFYLKQLEEKEIACTQLTESKNKIFKVFSLVKYIIKNKPDTIIAYLDPPSMSACIAKICSPKFKLIVSERNITTKIRLREFIKFNLYRLADFVVPNSNTQKKIIDKNFPFLSKKNVLISNCIDTSTFLPNDNGLYQTGDSLNIIVVGRVMPQKNPMGLINAIKIVREKGYNVKIRWFGYQKDKDYFIKCINLVKELTLESCFEFLPPTKCIREEMIKADALCLASFYEGYPNVICEAMSCELPIICSDVSDNSSIVTDNINGYIFDPNKSDDIAEKIIKLLELSPEERKKMGKLNRKKVLVNNSLEIFITKYQKLL